jgi:hypothetical protein
MKSKLLIISMILAGSLAAGSAYSQVRVNVGIGTPVVYERDYPGYSYYTYPAWHGHYHDRFYYAHYHAAFEREHRGYFEGRRFDHERFERERHVHPYNGRGHGRQEHDRGRH